tara:strand:+ start:6889 stop:7464 length:576 start_codon:yes stop_codon:yes gene_type:complete
MSNTIRVYDEVLPVEWCENLIELFESNPDHHHILDTRNKSPKFTELCVNRVSKQHVTGLVQFVRKIYDKYKRDIGLRYIPDFQFLEEFRVKRYLVGNGDCFNEHVDIQREQTAKRAVSFLFYLNTCEGSTIFTRQELNISPKCGSVVVFNPTWEYPHKGLPPTVDSKYVMSTYLHYPNMPYHNNPYEKGNI